MARYHMHGGGGPGYTAAVGYLPEPGISISILNNRYNNQDILRIYDALLRVLLRPEVESSWARSEVILDGKMTTKEEWINTVSVDLTLVEKHVGPTKISSTCWFKNDGQWLYMLVRLPVEKLERPQGVWIAYLWPYRCCPYEHSDFSWVDSGGNTWDAYGLDIQTGRWLGDLEARPAGENNVEGKASCDGTYYWFEFRKELESGDDYDWSLSPGETIADSRTGELALGVTLGDETTWCSRRILLRLASVL